MALLRISGQLIRALVVPALVGTGQQIGQQCVNGRSAQRHKTV